MGVLGGVHRHHAVLVEQTVITLDQNCQVGPVFKAQPGASVRQHISARRSSNVQSWAHATAAFLVAGTFVVQAREFPIPQFCGVGAAFVTAGNKGCLSAGDVFQRRHNVFPFCGGRIRGRAHQDKVVVHDGKTLDAPTIGHKFFLGGLIVHKHDVCVTASPHVQGLTGAQGHNLHIHAGGRLEGRQQLAKQARLFGRCRGGHDDLAGLSPYRRGHAQREHGQAKKASEQFHKVSPCKNKWACG